MKTINYDKLMCIEMFHDWKKVREECGDITPQSSDEDLGQGFSDFVAEWCRQNEYSINIWEPEEGKRKGQYFFDDETGKKVYYEGNLEDDLLTRYSEWVLGD